MWHDYGVQEWDMHRLTVETYSARAKDYTERARQAAQGTR